MRDLHYGASVPRARVLAVVLHGRNQDPAWMEEHVVRPLGLAEIAYCTPAASDRSWYPTTFLAPFGDNEPRLTEALDRVGLLVDELTAMAKPVVVIGFSQGACLACELVYRRRAHPPAALVAFTGGLIGPRGTRWLATPTLDLPVLITGSETDPFVPLDRMRESAVAFTALGARVTELFHPAGDKHEISEPELAAARALLSAV